MKHSIVQTSIFAITLGAAACGVNQHSKADQSTIKRVENIASISTSDVKDASGATSTVFSITCRDGRRFDNVSSNNYWIAHAWDTICSESYPQQMRDNWKSDKGCQSITSSKATDPLSWESVVSLGDFDSMVVRQEVTNIYKDSACKDLYAAITVTDLLDLTQSGVTGNSLVYNYSARNLSQAVAANAAKYPASVDYIKATFNIADFKGNWQSTGSIDGPRFYGAFVIEDTINKPDVMIEQQQQVDAAGKVISTQAFHYFRDSAFSIVP